jgi:succinate dehydrogenase / fumarate reductase cytochrome b subunit
MPLPSHGSDARPPLVLRLFSLSGLLPLGAFLVVHLAINARAVRGEAAFARAVGIVQRIPALPLLEWTVVFAPLLFHAIVGLWLVVTRTPLAATSPYPPALRVAVRATGVLVLAFLAMHLPELRFCTPGSRLDGGELATLLVADLSATSRGVPWRGLAYLAGTACVSFHFAASLWGFLATTSRGRTSAKLRRWAGWGAAAGGAAMWIVFANVVVFEATGARMFGGAPEEEAPREPCPTAEPGQGP